MFRPSTRLLAQQRQPLIKFLGKRSIPASVDHSRHVHPASEQPSLPDSFAESFANYRSRAQQHGPLKTPGSSSTSGQTYMSAGFGGVGGNQTYGAIGGASGASLGTVKPSTGEFFDRSELPKRFRRMAWTDSEIEAVDSAGASLWN